MKPTPQPLAAHARSPKDAARERARFRHQRLLRHPVPEFLAAWEYWSAELRITAEDLKRLQEEAGLPPRQRIGVTTLRRWIRGTCTPNLAALATLTRVLLGDGAHWYEDFIGRGLRHLEELGFYEELEARNKSAQA